MGFYVARVGTVNSEIINVKGILVKTTSGCSTNNVNLDLDFMETPETLCDCCLEHKVRHGTLVSGR